MKEIDVKIRTLLVAALLIIGMNNAPVAHASERPIVNSFTFTPDQVDLQNVSTLVNFELIASHPFGIENQQILVTLTNDKQQIGVNLVRTETPMNPKLTKVTFKASLNIPRNVSTGSYSFMVQAIKNNNTAGYQYESDAVKVPNFRTTIGAENGLLVSAGGYADLTHPTFVGPTYDGSTLGSFINRTKYSGATLPIWKVNETIEMSDIYELQIPALELKVASTTPDTCESIGSKLQLISQGTCSYSVYTERDKFYKKNIDSRNIMITQARLKPTMSIQDLSPQDIKIFPSSLSLPQIYASGTGWVLPNSITPEICSATGFTLKVISSGICFITYETFSNSTYLASGLYKQKIEILKDGQPVVVPTPVVTPAPTPTVKPVVKNTITCTKGTKSVKKTAISPKCPAGYKLKK